jgi:hypothetical protein
MRKCPSAAAAVVCLAAASPAAASTAGSSAHAQQRLDAAACLDDAAAIPAPRAGAPRIAFGIYPGGLAGQVGGPPVTPRPESEAKIAAALERLRPPGRTLKLHFYRGLSSSPAAMAREERQMRHRLNFYGARGFRLDYALTYRTHDAVAEWAAFVRRLVRRYGRHPALASLQVTNEVNVPGSPDSSDGAYRGAREALIAGVRAAASEKRRRRAHVEIGFNWFHKLSPANEVAFWTFLRDRGGRAFVRALDWVGVDAYPGSFVPGPGADTRRGVLTALRAGRCLARYAGIPARVPIHVQELGWGTGPGRSPEQQRAQLERMIRAVHEHRGTFNVTSLQWFSLRDSSSAAPSFQQQWGLLRDNYRPKPAFGAYAALIRRFGR